MDRREFLKRAGLGAMAMALPMSVIEAAAKKAAPGRDPRILIVSGWQEINIGDVAHTSGLVAVLKRYIPNASITLWIRDNSPKVIAMLKKHFPDLPIVAGEVDIITGKPYDQGVLQAFAQNDMLIHSSGEALYAPEYIQAWWDITHKPYGVFSITIYAAGQDYIPDKYVSIINNASFFFVRETKSLKILNDAGFKGKNILFVPDVVFASEVSDDPWAEKFMTDNALEEKKFICVIPRHRFTPFHRMNVDNKWPIDRSKYVDAINEAKKEQDLSQLVVVITEWVRQTGGKAVLCPEVSIQPELYPFIMKRLPDDVKPKVVSQGYWMPDQATSLYARCAVVVSFECHSPIMALSHDTPAFYLRQPEDTIKGQMFADLGLGDWVFEIEESNGQQIAAKLMEVKGDYATAVVRVKKAMKEVATLYEKGFKVINKEIESILK